MMRENHWPSSLLSCEQPLYLLSRRACQATDTLQESGEQRLRDGDLRHLEDCPPRMAHDLCSNLYQLQLDALKRPVCDLSWQGQPAHEVAQIVRKDEQGETLSRTPPAATKPCLY